MLKYSITVLLSILSVLTYAQQISYQLHMPKPQSHYFEVEMVLVDFKENSLELKMPVWAPGSYLIREFSKNVNQVKAFNEKGESLAVNKTAKNVWKIEKGKAKTVKVKYEVYAFELSVRTSFLDLTHGYVNGTSMFLYMEKYKSLKGNLTIYPYKNFKIVTTALPATSEGVQTDGSFSFSFNNYDHLVDCPIEIGNQKVFVFESAGVKHTVALYGDGNYNIDTLNKDMARITKAATNVFGSNPNKEYTFIIHNVVDGQGGLEHTNSTTLSVNRWTYEGEAYLGFLSLVAHEYFHLWNVKRIRPFELGPFNYDQENYTSLLWVMEGFTSYYDELLLLRAGYYSKDTYLRKLFSSLNYVEGSVGSRVQPVAHASYDAWIKAYRPNENSSNTTMTYYSRGAVIAAMLDAKIISKYKGKKCLDHFMQQLYKEYFEDKQRGFTANEFKAEIADFLGENMDQFFADYIDGTEIPDYNKIFAHIGLNVGYVGKPELSSGLVITDQGGKLMVSRIRSDSAGEEAGFSVGDEIIGCNGYRVNKNAFDSFLKKLNEGEEIEILYAREEILYSTKFSLKMYEQPRYDFSLNFDRSTLPLQEYWLRTEE